VKGRSKQTQNIAHQILAIRGVESGKLLLINSGAELKARGALALTTLSPA